MTFTFSGNLDTALDRVRDAIGDVYQNRPWLTDETILAKIAAASSEVWAAVACVDSIIARVSSQTDFTNASLSKAAGQLMEHYTDLRKLLEKKAASTDSLLDGNAGALPYPKIGGLSISGDQALRQNTDVPAPTFAKGSDDIPGGPSNEAPWYADELRGGG